MRKDSLFTQEKKKYVIMQYNNLLNIIIEQNLHWLNIFIKSAEFETVIKNEKKISNKQ